MISLLTLILFSKLINTFSGYYDPKNKNYIEYLINNFRNELTDKLMKTKALLAGRLSPGLDNFVPRRYFYLNYVQSEGKRAGKFQV